MKLRYRSVAAIATLATCGSSAAHNDPVAHLDSSLAGFPHVHGAMDALFLVVLLIAGCSMLMFARKRWRAVRARRARQPNPTVVLQPGTRPFTGR